MPRVEPVLTLSEKARRRVLEIKAGEPDGETLALWVEIVGVNGQDYAYDLYFDDPALASPEDAVQINDDITVVVPSDSVEQLQGATLDMTRDLLNPGLVIVNPNKPPSPSAAVGAHIDAGPPPDPGAPVAERVQWVLDHHIAPAIASHGGTATLVAVEDDAAFLRLGGGCAGCGMAAVTLSQGIEVAIRDNVPEINRVVDVTDHAAGDNPYFEAAKK
jgi:Fe/S biogenesis protein NfuA